MRNVISSSLALASLVALAGFASGCGQLDGDPAQAPIIATIRGQLANPEGYAAGANMRVAIVWGGDGGGVRVSQDVPVQPVFPSQFKLDVRALPPLDAMRAPGKVNKPSECSPGYDPSSGAAPPPASALCDDAPPSAGGVPSPTPAPPSGGGVRPQSDLRPALPGDPFRIAIGTLVAYEDLNGNGILDLLDDKATTAVDRVVGVNEDLYVVYAEGVAPAGTDFAQLSIPKGFSQLSLPSDVCTRGEVGGEATDVRTDAGAGAPVPMPTRECTSGEPQVHAIDALFTLPLTASPKLTEFMCQGQGGSMGVAVAMGGVNGNGSTYYPPAGSPRLYCKADGSSFSYTPCENSQNLCGDRVVCDTTVVSRPSPVPANWPCVSP